MAIVYGTCRECRARGGVHKDGCPFDDRANCERDLAVALGLLNRWLSQHRDGGATDPCGVSAELVAETRKAVER